MQNIKDYKTIITELTTTVAVITLNRPEIHNALNDILIEELSDIFSYLKDSDEIRAIILTGAGKSFCAGADLNLMKGIIDFTYEENITDAKKLINLLELINNCPKPVIAKIKGSTIGGGMGIISVCDILIAVDSAKFGFSEVSLGIAPAVISPYIIERIGFNHARELFLTGERITAQKALNIGLLNEIVPSENLDDAVSKKVSFLLKNSPNAMAKIKELFRQNRILKFNEIENYTANLLAELRTSKEGQEGLSSFLEKRTPNWIISK